MRKHIALAIALLLLFPSGVHAKTWSRKQLRQEVKAAAKHYRLSKADTQWLERASVDIVYVGAHESSGAWKAGSPGGCYGIFQFQPRRRINGRWTGWRRPKAVMRHLHHHHKGNSWRACAKCATWRFVKSYRDGGKAAIRKHWKATLGR